MSAAGFETRAWFLTLCQCGSNSLPAFCPNAVLLVTFRADSTQSFPESIGVVVPDSGSVSPDAGVLLGGGPV